MVSSPVCYIGTHDIQNVSVSSPQPDQVRVTGHIIQGSTISDVLLVINCTDKDPIEHRIQKLDRVLDSVVSGIPVGQCTVSVFIIDRDGEPFGRAAAVFSNVTIVSVGKCGCIVIYMHMLVHPYYMLLQALQVLIIKA